jgi:hypothetical protein
VFAKPLLIALLSAAVLALVPAAQAAVPDPLAPGPYTTDKVEYDAGTLLLNLPTTGTTSVPMRGSVIYPTVIDQSRIIVFVHGRHAVCIGTPAGGSYFCGDETSSDGTPTNTDIRSYGGYDYLSQNLASHGFTVMSIEANVTNFDNNYTDAGAGARSQIIYASLNLLYRWNNGAGPTVEGDPSHTVGTKLVGKLDFSDGIGLMGHSRGGDAVTDYIAYTRNLSSSLRNRFKLDAVLALAPTYYTANKVPYGPNYATLLPACDGDVSNLQGARFFENSKYAPGNDTSAKIQWYVQGTDHNFFNTVWTDDDNNTSDPVCGRTSPTTKRLTPADQRKVGVALMNSFFRRYVGGETDFDPLMTGAQTLPSSVTLNSGVGAAQEVKTSYVGPKARRLDVLRPEPTTDPITTTPPPAEDPNATTIDAQGGAITNTGLSTFSVCDPSGPSIRGSATLQTAYPFCSTPTGLPSGQSGANRSIGTQFTVAWDGPATLEAALGATGESKDVSSFGVLDLRAGTIRWDARNPQGDHIDPTSATQDFEVTLVDADGKTATTSAAQWTTSLQPSIGLVYQHVVLNGIRIPLSAFAGSVDLKRIASVKLGFGGKTPTGAIQLADIGFQENAPAGGWSAGTTGAPVVVTPTVGEPDGPESVLPGPVIGTPEEVGTAVDAPSTAATTPACADATPPSSRLTRLSVRAKTVRISGVAVDQGCPAATGTAAGGVQRTLIQISRSAGSACQFVTVKGRLTKRSDCKQPIGIYAKGTGSWSLSIAKAKLPKGVYAVRVITYDMSGNATPLKVRRVRVA